MGLSVSGNFYWSMLILVVPGWYGVFIDIFNLVHDGTDYFLYCFMGCTGRYGVCCIFILVLELFSSLYGEKYYWLLYWSYGTVLSSFFFSYWSNSAVLSIFGIE